jgi:TP901 family phage tail tape measure protein
MSASRVRAGQVFVEIGADPRKFFATLGRLNKAMGSIGRNVASVGTRMAGIGAGMAAPIIASVNAGTKFENVLLGIRASTGATQDQIDRIKASSMAMSQALGVGPTEAAAGMLELLKAGMSVESVLSGAGQAALQFAKVGNMPVSEAAVVMADAMNVFKVSGEVAANTLSAAADSSSTSIELITQSFAQVSAVAALANQSLQDTAAAIAVLANAGIKGSDAGTSLKTMLMRLMAPANDAAEAMAGIGLSTQSFRNADGTMKPLVEIIRTLNDAMAGMDQAAKDDVFRRIFGQDAIRAAAVLTSAGVEGFGAMRQSMDGAMSVGDKYATMQSGMAGAANVLMASLERLAVTISDAVGPAVLSIARAIAPVLDGFGNFLANNKEAVVLFAQVAAAAIGIGSALVGVGLALQGVSFSVGTVLKGFGMFSALLTPVGLVVAGIVAAGAAMYAFRNQIVGALGGVGELVSSAASVIGSGFAGAVSAAGVVLGDLGSIASTTFDGIYAAIAEGDLAGAMDILWLGLTAGWLRGVEAFMSVVDPFVASIQDVFGILGASIYNVWDKLYTDSAAVLNTMGAWIMGFFDNIANGVMATFDNLVGAIQIAWTRVQGFITGAEDTEQRVQDIKDENAARAEQRHQERPGIDARMNEAAQQNAEAERRRKEREAAVNEGATADAQDRQDRNEARADARRSASQQAQADVGSATRGKRESRARNDQFGQLLKDIEGATTIEQLRDMYGEFDALNANGRLTSVQASTIEAALEDAQERVTKNMVNAQSASSAAQAAAQGGADAATQDAQRSKAEVAGTFSAQAAMGMGFGSSLAERTAKAAEATAKGVGQLVDQGGGRVAA